MKSSLPSAIANFGAKAKAKLSNPGASGEPEDQLRAPFEQLLADLAKLSNLPRNVVTAVGESSVSDLKTRPDYAVTVHKALVGFIELKAPGKGADPRKFKDPHDKAQWEKLHSLPNLIYTDGNAFSLWQDAGLASPTVTVADPATGTGTYVLAVLRRIAETVQADEGAGAVQQATKVPASTVNDFLNLTTGGIRGKAPTHHRLRMSFKLRQLRQ